MNDNDPRLISLLEEIRDATRETAHAARESLMLNMAMMQSMRQVIKWTVIVLAIPVLGVSALWIWWAVNLIQYSLAS